MRSARTAKNMKKTLLYIAAAMAMLMPSNATADTQKLPVVEILGQNYYYYTVKKGESLYGICNMLGWNPQTVAKLNPKAAKKLEKDMRIYYPTGNATPEPEKPVEKSADSATPISHIVKKGETVYSISRQYGIPVERIYESNPGSRKGIKAGETLRIKQIEPDIEGGDEIYYYTVKNGDTLYRIARQYNTSVENILTLNPGVSEFNFRSGSTIKIIPGSQASKVRTEIVKEERINGFDTYKVGKNDNWNTIAQKTGTDEEDIRQANPGMNKLKKNATITIPKVEQVDVERKYTEVDPREKTREGIRELYEEVNNVEKSGEGHMRVALLLDNPTSQRDLEFTRGMLVAFDEMKGTGSKVELDILQGPFRSDVDSITSRLAKADLIISTAEKDLSKSLADFAMERRIEIVNTFDVKNELYNENPSMMQLLPPSSYFNEAVASYMKATYPNSTLVLVGTADSSDNIAELLMERFKTHRSLSIDGVKDFEFKPDESYLVYVYPQRQADVARALANISEARERTLAEMAVVGRPSWVTLVEQLGDRFSDLEVMVPSRLYFDETDGSSRAFTRQYEQMFGHEMVKSFPVYAASGYDVANYFIPSLLANGGDFNAGMKRTATLQQSMNLERISNWGGFVNPTSYIVKFFPGMTEKIEIR